ncbi:hypothetical protein ISF_08410 [Cordyceps fumosorosea ARSEF 2679]|uniref:DUF6594 domain-containing protein n=1 Tax=Cordyceps fumosorosea (strain ARSEF 2679) TaxID=1081104 RepID=A0A167MC02_CORFA|nr:hypothetical protein ISF_08410 [Cordyceps fumosorosea ARSEF 2679]OAA54183.1 hypothetical protein ISF_08410 [Cordyceps fumosorosea ARSEF 2679]
MDVENGTGREGFPRLARRMAETPDYETFVFRKFDRLSARNLLHLESKLAYLEWQLDKADEQAAASPDNETLRSLRVWEAFEENSKHAGRLEQTRMKIAEDIRETLKEYRKICCIVS